VGDRTTHGSPEGRVQAGLTKRLRSRQALLEAAEAAFTEHGWQRARLEDVARQAGVSVATAYNHFPSKYALIGHVYSSHVAPVLQQAEHDEAVQRPAAQALADHLHQLGTVFRANRPLTAAFANAVQEFTARVQQRPAPDDQDDPRVLVPVPHGLGVLINAAQCRGELSRHRDATDLSEQMTFLLFLRCVTHPDETPHETAEMLLRMILGVLAPELLVTSGAQPHRR
jgi:AcrR family transcriptional regulator